MELKIYTCAEWGAAPPRNPIVVTGRPQRIIDHHTAGHAPNLDHKPSETLEEAKAYARMLQQDHFGRGWSDTGQNFLVSRSGHVLEGRHGSVSAIAAGKMVISAHCPGQNDQPGIEHEHFGAEELTEAQKVASIALHTWICRKTGIRPTEFHPHGNFNSTECPSATVRNWLPQLRNAVIRELSQNGAGGELGTSAEFRTWVDWRLGRGAFKGHGRANPNVRPAWLPKKVPAAWWTRLQRIVRAAG